MPTILHLSDVHFGALKKTEASVGDEPAHIFRQDCSPSVASDVTLASWPESHAPPRTCQARNSSSVQMWSVISAAIAGERGT